MDLFLCCPDFLSRESCSNGAGKSTWAITSLRSISGAREESSLLSALSRPGFASLRHRLDPTLVSLSFLHEHRSFRSADGIFPVGDLWSLAVEEQFYAVWPLVVRWLDEKALARLAAGLLFVAPCLRWIATGFLHGHWNIYGATPFRMDLLAAGALIGIAWRSHRATVETIGHRYGLPIVAFASTILLLLSWYPWFQPSAGTVLVNVWLYELSLIGSAGALLWALGRRAVSILTLRPMAYMGRISYTFYLVHPAPSRSRANTRITIQHSSPLHLRFYSRPFHGI